MRLIFSSLLLLAFLSTHSLAGVVSELQSQFNDNGSYETAAETDAVVETGSKVSGPQEVRSRCCMGEDVLAGSAGATTPCSADCTLFLNDGYSHSGSEKGTATFLSAQVLERSGAPPPFRPPIA